MREGEGERQREKEMVIGNGLEKHSGSIGPNCKLRDLRNRLANINQQLQDPIRGYIKSICSSPRSSLIKSQPIT